MGLPTLQNRRIAIFEDSDSKRDRLCSLVRLCRGVPIPAVQHAPKLDALRAYFKSEQIELLISDHRLFEHHDYATYCGAQAVAESYRLGIGGIVLTAYGRNDADSSIRLNRRWIPALLHSRELTPDSLQSALLLADQEVRNNDVPRDRVPHRTIMTVQGVEPRGDTKIVKVMMAQWNSAQEVGFPLNLVPKKFQAAIKPGNMLFAEVNIEAARQEDLYFHNFELPDADVLKKAKTLFGRP
jgi:hypothetical protein